MAATAAFAFSPTTASSPAKVTGLPRSSASRTATGARLNFSSGPFLGLPRWLHRITLPPFSISFLMVGSAATMRLSLVMTPSFMGTLKSQRTSTRLPRTSSSSTVFLPKPIFSFSSRILKTLPPARGARGDGNACPYYNQSAAVSQGFCCEAFNEKAPKLAQKQRARRAAIKYLQSFYDFFYREVVWLE